MPQQQLQIRCAQNASHSNICKSNMPRMNSTALFAHPMCSECAPQLHLQIHGAQTECHSNICKSNVPRMNVTATFVNPMCSECKPQQHLQIREWFNTCPVHNSPLPLLLLLPLLLGSMSAILTMSTKLGYVSNTQGGVCTHLMVV